MADTDLARELSQRQVLDTALTDGALGLGEQRRAQFAVVIRAVSHRLRSLTDEVVVDSIVVNVYIVAHDYFQLRRHP
jgi:hypothetical protein